MMNNFRVVYNGGGEGGPINTDGHIDNRFFCRYIMAM